jgi:hypothetical protein
MVEGSQVQFQGKEEMSSMMNLTIGSKRTEESKLVKQLTQIKAIWVAKNIEFMLLVQFGHPNMLRNEMIFFPQPLRIATKEQKSLNENRLLFQQFQVAFLDTLSNVEHLFFQKQQENTLMA